MRSLNMSTVNLTNEENSTGPKINTTGVAARQSEFERSRHMTNRSIGS